MKALFTLAALLLVSTSAHAGPSYRCEVTAFGRIYDGQGFSENEARAEARVACAERENTMFCKFSSMSCTRVLTTETYCEIEAFGRLYWSRAPGVQEARQNTRAQCLSRENAMFCTDQKVSCLAL